MIDINALVDRLCHRYPSTLVDAILEHDSGRRIVAVKNVTVNEEFFQGHFPGTPLMPAVLMLESWSQVAAVLLLHREGGRPNARVYVRGFNDAKFRRQIVPGDRLRLEISLGRRSRSGHVAATSQASSTIERSSSTCLVASGPTGLTESTVTPASLYAATRSFT